MKLSRRPYLIDWRFLPEWILKKKDTIRHRINLLGKRGDQASAIGRVWFRSIRSGVIRSIASSNVIFVHIPRTGGTAICKALYGRNLPHLSIAYYHSLKQSRLSTLASFAVVRDPYDRLISAYRFLISGGTKVMACSRFDPLRLRESRCFDDFVETIFGNPEACQLYDALRMQHSFVVDLNGQILVDRLFTFDDLRNKSAELLVWTGSQDLVHTNESEYRPIAASAITRRRIWSIYRRDYALFERAKQGFYLVNTNSMDILSRDEIHHQSTAQERIVRQLVSKK